MKLLAIITSLLITTSSASFGAEAPCTECILADAAAHSTLDYLQKESQTLDKTASPNLTAFVLAKLNHDPVAESGSDILDRLQKETEDISIMKPVLFVASVIERQFEKRSSDTSSKR